MSCQHVRERLDDYVDGHLSGADGVEVERHLESCAGCRAQEREIRDLLRRADALRGETKPGRDLWDEIRSTIEERSVEAHYRVASGSIWPRVAAAAAVLLVIVGTAVVSYRMGQGSAAVIVDAEPVGFQQASMRGIEIEYLEARSQLIELLDARKSSLPPSTLQRIEDNVKTIDDSVLEIRAALEQDPTNPDLNQLLVATYSRQVQLLQSVHSWSTRM